MRNRWISFLETLVIVAIFLVIVQTFLEDFSTLRDWPVRVRTGIQLAGFGFDLFFTLEFLVRIYSAGSRGRVFLYLRREHGWIDFLASVPLLMFSSGPIAFAFLLGGGALAGVTGVLNVLKVIKAIRIARILRLMRIVKLLPKARYLDSPMAQRHLSMVIAISVSVLIFSLLINSLFADLLNHRGVTAAAWQREQGILATLKKSATGPQGISASLLPLIEADESLLLVRDQGRTLFSRYENGAYARQYAPGDYSYLKDASLELFFDEKPLVRQLAWDSLVFLAIVILTVLAYLACYAPHFTLTVTDPIQVMVRGMEDPDYRLKVDLGEEIAGDEVFQLARLYNERYVSRPS